MTPSPAENAVPSPPVPLPPVPLPRIVAGGRFEPGELEAVMDAVLAGEVGEVELASLLTALATRGESAEEIAATAAALRARMHRLSTQRSGLLDTCGTGGDGSGTFNISTAAAIVTAAAGQPVAKHGNRAASSRSGSADVLRVLGVDVEAPLERVGWCLDRLGLGFCFAPLWHDSMRQVAAVRRRLGFPTLFNCVGPLSNPARAEFQLIGVGRQALQHKLAAAALHLGTRRTVVVWGTDGLDEVSLAAPTEVALAEGATQDIERLVWRPEDFGLATTSASDALRAADPEDSAAKIRDVLDGQPGPCRDIVLLNAAAALWTAERAASLDACLALAAEAIDSGGAATLLTQLASLSHGRDLPE